MRGGRDGGEEGELTGMEGGRNGHEGENLQGWKVAKMVVKGELTGMGGK